MNQPEVTPDQETILIVDDRIQNLQLLSLILSKEGYGIQIAQNGPEALRIAFSASPDLILLDINMPEMNGYEVCSQLKEHEQTQGIPIIFISALDETEDKVNAFNAGGVDYMTKPYQLAEVLVRVKTHLTIRRLQQQLQKANQELEQRVWERTTELLNLNWAYERFVPREFLSLLQKENIVDTRLGDQTQRTMSIMFTDIRGFTSLSEEMTPQDNFNFINAYLSRVGPAIREHHGFIDKYIGDGIMALFPERADDAVQAAIVLHQTLGEFNQHHLRRGKESLQIGVGIHTGSMMLGIIGEEERMQGTVISDAVNLASRLEGLTRLYAVSIIISEETRRCLITPDDYTSRFLGKVQLKGKQASIPIFEIFDSDDEVSIALKLDTRSIFEEGLRLYHNQQFSAAREQFNTVLKSNRQDKVAQRYIHQADYYEIHGVPPNWDGADILTEK